MLIQGWKERVKIASGRNDMGAAHRAMQLGKLMHDAGMWDSSTEELWLHHPYDLHNNVFGFIEMPVTEFIKNFNYFLMPATPFSSNNAWMNEPVKLEVFKPTEDEINEVVKMLMEADPLFLADEPITNSKQSPRFPKGKYTRWNPRPCGEYRCVKQTELALDWIIKDQIDEYQHALLMLERDARLGKLECLETETEEMPAVHTNNKFGCRPITIGGIPLGTKNSAVPHISDLFNNNGQRV